MTDDPDEVLATHEREIEAWIEGLRERRERLGELGEEFDGLQREDLPEDVAASLSVLLVSLEDDLDAQVADLEGDVEMVRDLRDTLERVSGEALSAELDEYVETMDGVFADKRETVEQLVATTDRIIDRFERLIAGR